MSDDKQRVAISYPVRLKVMQAISWDKRYVEAMNSAISTINELNDRRLNEVLSGPVASCRDANTKGAPPLAAIGDCVS